MAVFNATLIKLYDGGVAIGHLTNVSADWVRDMIDVTTKDSGADAEFLPGKKSGTYSAEGILDMADTVDFDSLWVKMEAGTVITMMWSTEVTGDTTYSQSIYVSSAKMGAGTEEAVSFSMDFQGTGDVTVATVT